MIKDRAYWEDRITDALSNRHESNELDFKSDLSEDNARLKEHINALGHERGGGSFVFGVTRSFSKSTTAIDHEAIITKISNLAKDGQDPPLQITSYVISTSLGKLLCIHVQSPTSLPIFIKDRSPWGGQACFKRNGNQTVPMTSDEIRDLLAQSQSSTFDESLVEETKPEDLDSDLLERGARGFTKSDGFGFKNLALLRDSGILVEGAGKDYASVAGWLMFGKQPQQIRRFKNSFIEFQQFRGKTRDQVVKKHEIDGPLPVQIENVITILLQNVWVVPKIPGLIREDAPAYDRQILREVVTNAVTHRDYGKMHQPVKIALFTDRLEIENPGGLMPGLTTLNLIHKRSWRNPKLAERMKVFGLGEMDGQGIDRLIQATRRIQLPAPLFSGESDSFKVTLSGPKTFPEYTPIEKRFTVIAMLTLSDFVDNESLRLAFGIDIQTAGTLIKSMMADGIIEKVGMGRKFAKYKLTRHFFERIFG